jgi:hypothetical protein
MQRAVWIAGAMIVFASAGARAQACTAPSQPLFDFQVSRLATYIVDTAVHPRPSPERMIPQPPLIVKFIVDTNGRVDSTTFEILLAKSHGVADSARSALHLWRYTPALAGRCKVPQLIQAVIVP